MSYGLHQMGQDIKRQGMAGLEMAATAEDRRNATNDNMEFAEEQAKNQSHATLGGYGAQADIEKYLDAKDAADNFNGAETQTIDGASGEFAVSPSETTISADGVVSQQPINGSAVSTTPEVLQQATIDQFKDKAVESGLEEAGKQVAAETVKEGAVEAGKQVALETAAEAAATEVATEAVATQALSQAGSGVAMAEGVSAGASFGPWGMLAGLATSAVLNELF